MKIREIISCLEQFAPPAFQEEYDNSGLIAGNENLEITGVLISVDCTEKVIEEAISKKCNLVISHHPLVFGKGLRKITGKNYVERTLLKAIKSDIAVFAMHTNLDNIYMGVNQKICQKLGLINAQILQPKKHTLSKLVTFVPVQQADAVRNEIFKAGAGFIGNYSECSFNVMGTGTFRANDGANPFSGDIGKQHREQEMRIETIFPSHMQSKIIDSLKKVHPYEEVAYEIYRLENLNQFIGSGMIGELESEMEEQKFLGELKLKMNTKGIRHTFLTGRKIKRVAVCGGSGSFLLDDAIWQNADIFITGDFKYHQFFDAEGKIVIADIGHFESEQYTVEVISELLNKNFTTFAVRLSETETNPIKYYH